MILLMGWWLFLEPSLPIYDELEEIKKAGERSADLTRQLLAFARTQTVSPKVLDLNKTVAGMISMLQRLIGEEIELVEDEPAILKMTRKMLERHGYHVSAAKVSGETIRFTKEYDGELHLLVADVIMSEMNGRDLATKILSMHANLKCLFMSDYTANVIAHHGVLDEGVNFIQNTVFRETTWCQGA